MARGGAARQPQSSPLAKPVSAPDRIGGHTRRGSIARPPQPWEHVNKLIGAVLLALLALFMAAGFLRSDLALSKASVLAAFLITVALPAAGAVLLARGHFAEKSRLTGRKAELRRNTIDAEILRLAGQHAGRLTAVEVATALSMTPESAAEALSSLGVRGQADVEVTDDGVLVYSFYDVRHLGGKSTAKGVLDA